MNLKSHRKKFAFFPVIVLVLGLVASVALVKLQTRPKTSAATTLANWKDLILNWPVADPDSIEFLLQPTGDISQTLIKGGLWYYRPTPTSPWSSGQILTEQNITRPFLSTQYLDSFSTFYSNSVLYQTVTQGSYWWSHENTKPWTWSGTLFYNETISGSCKTKLPVAGSPIDTMTSFPYAGKIGVTLTKGGIFWFKPDSLTPTYTYCGRPIAGYTGSFTGHTNFQIRNAAGNLQLAELFTSGKNYWFFPDTADRYTFTTGVINSPYSSAESSQVTVGSTASHNISPNIFGANLIWHSPYAPNPTAIVAPIKDLGLNLLRFPGGCGGDSYNALGTNTGLTLANYVSILKNTGAKSLYAFNLEGEGAGTTNHVNLNCHNLYDYAGKFSDVQTIANYFITNGVPILAAETGNEPWAGYPGLYNWNETWTSAEYADEIKYFPAVTTDRIAATGGKSDWEEAVVARAPGFFNYFQLHPYTYGDTIKDFPLTQVNATSNSINGIRGRGREPAITEYNLYCWDGVYSAPGVQAYSINPSAGGFGQGLYLAQHLALFARENIKYAAYWQLFEGLNSTWKCGLIKETSPGIYSYTPAGHIFKQLSFLGKDNRQILSTSNTGLSVIALSAKPSSSGGISTVFINPSSTTLTKVRYNPSVTISSISTSTFFPDGSCSLAPDATAGLLWTCLTKPAKSSAVTYTQSGSILNLELKPFSVSVVHINASSLNIEDSTPSGRR